MPKRAKELIILAALLFLWIYLGIIAISYGLSPIQYDFNSSKSLSDPVVRENEGLFVDNEGFLRADRTSHHESQVLANKREDPIEKWRPLVSKYFPESEVDMALAIIREESRGNPNEVNWNDYHKTCGCYGSFGLFQLGRVHMGSYGFNWNNRFDPETNVRVAYEIWKMQGWKQGWNTSYKKIIY